MNPWGPRLGRAQYLRQKGMVYLEIVRPVIILALGGGAALKYLTGLPTRWVVIIMVALAVGSEILAVILGWLEHRSGATEAHFQLAADTDPYKRQSLELLSEIRDAVGRRWPPGGSAGTSGSTSSGSRDTAPVWPPRPGI